MSQYITQNIDTDKHFCKFFSVRDLLILARINHSIHNLIRKLIIVEQYSKFKLSEGITFLVDFAFANCYVELLDNIYKFNIEHNHAFIGIIFAARHGHIKVFEWFYNNNIITKYYSNDFNVQEKNLMMGEIVEEAIFYNRSDIVELFKKYEPDIVRDVKISNSYIYQKYILKKDIDCDPSMFVEDEIKLICCHGYVDELNRIDALDKYFLCDYFMPVDNNSLNYFDVVILYGQKQILEWFRTNYIGYVSNYALNSLGFAIECNQYSIIEWFIDHKFVIDNLNNLIEEAKNRNRPDIVNLLKKVDNNHK